MGHQRRQAEYWGSGREAPAHAPRPSADQRQRRGAALFSLPPGLQDSPLCSLRADVAGWLFMMVLETSQHIKTGEVIHGTAAVAGKLVLLGALAIFSLLQTLL